jgi:murein DD-endopeptidase MepM/ murein hydrolase activator NlpD
MGFRSRSRILADWLLRGAIVSFVVLSMPSRAGEVAPVTEQTSAHNPDVPAATSNTETSRVFLAPAVGRVTVGLNVEQTGKRMFASRSQAGSASVVSFSATQPRPAFPALSTSIEPPLLRARLTSVFGARRAAAGGGSRAHAGVDLAAPLGSPVTAALPGRVSMAGWAGGYGNLVVVEHGNGLETRYAHLSSIRVVPGQQIRQGELVGLVGSTGHSTGPHLHYEIRQNGRPLNPLR